MKTIQRCSVLFLLAFATGVAQAQPADLVVGVPDISSPVTLSGELTNHNGGPVFHGPLRSALLVNRNALKQFFSPGGSRVQGPLPVNWAKGNHFTTINWERHMVLAVANEQGGDELRIGRVLRRSTESGRLLEYVAVYGTRKNTRANAGGSSAYSLAIVPREAGTPAFRAVSKAEWDKEHRERILAATRPGDGLPAFQAQHPATEVDAEVPQQTEADSEIQIDFARHSKGDVGPRANKAAFVQSKQDYLRFFQMGGRQSGAGTPYYQGGARLVVVSNGRGSERKAVEITKLVLRGDVLEATVRRDALPFELSHIKRPWEAVSFDESQLGGRTVNRVVLIDVQGTELASYKANGERIECSEANGALGALQQQTNARF